jgi:hypothetical protein
MTQALPGVRRSEIVSEPISFHLLISLLSPWVECNFPIPPGIYEDVCIIVQESLLLASMSHQTHLIGLGGPAS